MSYKKTIIVSNKARCRKCNTIVESTNRHHLAMCWCGAIYVDGGTEYLRRGFSDYNLLEELSETREETTEHTESAEPTESSE